MDSLFDIVHRAESIAEWGHFGIKKHPLMTKSGFLCVIIHKAEDEKQTSRNAAKKQQQHTKY
jgi:hypothetical protein